MTRAASVVSTPPALDMAGLKVLERLGISPYSQIALVPTEAWDAADDVKGCVDRKRLLGPAALATRKQS